MGTVRLSSVFLTLLVLHVSFVASTNMPVDSCQCAKLRGLERSRTNLISFRRYSQLGSFNGIFNSQGGRFKPHQRGSGGVNLEVYQEVGNVVQLVRARAALTLEACCRACSISSSCYQYHFFNSKRLIDNKNVKGFVDNVQCYLLDRVGGAGVAGDFKTPYSGDAEEQKIMAPYFPQSWVGGLCNSTVVDGSDSQRADSSDLATLDPDSHISNTFCLLTDRRVHVNILLSGFEDNAVHGDSPVLHTWIKELGFVWIGHEGKPHTLRMVARKGKQQAAGGAGFLSLVELDGQAMQVPTEVGQAVDGAGGLVVALIASDRQSDASIDQFAVALKGLAEVDVKLRAAHPMLQTAGEAEAHFVLEFMDLQMTRDVHGVLGQTFRESTDGVEKELTYSHLSRLLHRPFRQGEKGADYMDGAAADYVTTSIVSPDCRFSPFPVIAVA